MDPPRNWNSKAQATMGSPCNLPASTISASLLARRLLCLDEAILVTLAVAEFQRILGGDMGGELLTPVGVQEALQALACTDTHVMAALGAHIQIALQLGAVQHRIASGALDPQPFRHRARTALGLDARGHDLFEPGHGMNPRSAKSAVSATDHSGTRFLGVGVG